MNKRTAPAARAKGLLALVGILLLVVGFPWLMSQIGAGPVPDRWVSPAEMWDAVTTPDDGAVLITIFRYAAWLAWLFIVLSIVLEVVARLLGTDVPQLPGLSLPQGIARYVVGTAALLFVSLPAVGSWATASAAPMPGDVGSTTASSTALAGGLAATSAAGAVADQGASDAPTADRASDTRESVSHEVARGESLWSIAEQRLGDGTRYTEIVDLNRDTIPASHWISPGQTLQLPADAASDTAPSEDTRTVEAGDTLWDIAEDELGSGDRYTEIVDATGSVEQPDGDRLTDPDLIKPGWTLQLPGDGDASATTTPPAADTTADSAADPAAKDATTGAAGAGAGSGATIHTAAANLGSDTAADTTADDADDTDRGALDPTLAGDPADEWGSTVLGLSGLTAAGLVALVDLARRRHAARLGTPDRSDPTGLERDLRLAADRHTAETIDLALRHVAASAADAGRALPGLYSVRMTREQLDVQLADPMRLPAPWTSTADPRLWTLAVDRAVTLDRQALAEVAAPFPSLVVVGQDDEGAQVLVNLAQARTFAVVGAGEHTRETLAAMTLALATAPWSDATTVTVIGGDASLEQVIASPRVRFVPDMATYTLSVEVQISPTAREVIIVSGDLDARDRRRLDTAVASSPRVALAHAATSAPDGADALTIADDPSTAVLSPAYLQLHPQRLSEHDAARLADLFALVAPSTDRWAPPDGEPTLASIGEAAAAMGAPGIIVNPSADLPVDDAPTVRRSQSHDRVAHGTPVRWNTPVHTPVAQSSSTPGDDVPTVRRTGGLDLTALASAPHWLSNQITPTPGTPLPPVIAFPERVRELAAPTHAPVLRVLGPVDIDNVGEVAAAHRMRLTELAAFVNLHPGASGSEVDDALWPNRAQHDHVLVRNRALTGLGEWLVQTPLPDAGRTAAEGLVSDWGLFRGLVPGDPSVAGTDHLEQALGLVRGRPFAGVHPRHYVWAEALRAQMVFAITTTAIELARRLLMEGRWATALDATVVGLTVEPGVEALWRMQLLAAHELGDLPAVEAAAVGLADCARLADRELEAASLQLLATLPELTAAQTRTTTHHAV
ncbi:MAG: hypothetical protein C0493_06085 [Kytococcus sp.]|nr:hypothetical protein [Kytococcus sp.]